MNWLQKRLKELNYTHADLQAALAEHGIHRVRATITGWANDKPVSLLNDPVHTKILADVLHWSVLDMLVAAGYDIGVPSDLTFFIDAYRRASKRRKLMFMQNLMFVMEFLGNLTEEELDDPDSDEETDTKGN